MSAAWFIDGAYAMKCWNSLKRADRLDYFKLRQFLEKNFLDHTTNEKIEDAYYFNADPEPPTAKQNGFHNALQYPPPAGPGLRVKLYWLQEKELFWPVHMGVDPSFIPRPVRRTSKLFRKP